MAEIPVTIEHSLKDYLYELTQHYRLNRVILFGSMARGTFDQDSDIDLAIFSTDVTEENEIDIMADCLLRAMPYKLDIQPVVYPAADFYSDNDFIQNEIIARGIEIPLPKRQEIENQ
jgi:predicted nucleotidyltransferase